ncbi:MAG: hypothetical protein L6Q71_10825, partial [Planctomycetes bacterium]|nr:hypothetical protein [Planctomycetota bacterium]
LLVHRGKRGQSYVYELLYDGNAGGNSHFSGLLDPGKLINHQKNEHDSGQFEHTKSSESADLNAVLSSHAVKP